MERFQPIRVLGEGTFGSVVLCLNKATGERVAVKSLRQKVASWSDGVACAEVKALKQIVHPNIVELREVIKQNGTMMYIFDNGGDTLLEWMQTRRSLPSLLAVRNIVVQIVAALSCIHGMGMIHRDLKPENIFISPQGHIKVGDFGLARPKAKNKQEILTEYVSTRWYRAPEIIFRCPQYGQAADMWALGCIAAELLTLQPLFPGQSEADMLYRMDRCIGPISGSSWTEGRQRMQNLGFEVKSMPKTKDAEIGRRNVDNLISILNEGRNSSSKTTLATNNHSGLHPCAVDFVRALVKWNPAERLDANNLNQHDFLNCKWLTDSMPNASLAGKAHNDDGPAAESYLAHEQQPTTTQEAMAPTINRLPTKTAGDSVLNSVLGCRYQAKR